MKSPCRFLLAFAVIGGACRPTRPADLVVKNTAVYTMAAPAKADAIAVRDGEIVYLGDNAGSDAYIGDSTRVYDLGGRMVLPGFVDTHVHPRGGLSLTECQFDAIGSAQAIVDSVARCAANAPEKPWIRGRGWALPVFPNANPHRRLLDAVVSDRGVYLSAADGHSAWVNSKALQLAGITKATADPPKGRIERDPATGEPTGTLRESAMDLVGRLLPEPTLAERKQGLARALRLANEFGIVSVHDASVDPGFMAAYAELDREGELTTRVIAAQYVDYQSDVSAVVDSLVAWRDRYPGTRYFRPTAAKFFADGVIEAKTAALLEPYLESGGTTGDANFRQGQFDSLATRLDRAGIQIHIHAIGDRGIRMGLDAIAAAARANGPPKAPPIMAHIQLFDPEDIPRFKTLGVVASFQPLWAFADEYITDLTEPVLGPARSRWLYPIGSMVKSGATVAAGSDWTVSSLNPLEAIQVALTRRAPTDSAGPAWIPEEVVSLQTMLEAYTINGASASGDRARSGTLEVGKAADLIVIDRDLFAIPVTEIAKARVLLTLLDGRAVFTSRELR
ncbi:MAG: amidohydrolase [Gemmatimonadetes bacterium]|nr:amidohydrolase [Gemmatimonadota bacterium]